MLRSEYFYLPTQTRRIHVWRHTLRGTAWVFALCCWACQPVLAQTTSKPTRAEAPTFQPGQFDGIFFEAPTRQLNGEFPTRNVAPQAATNIATSTAGGISNLPASTVRMENSSSDSQSWPALISPISLEDLIKGGKLRLDKIVTTPAAFKGGGFVEARTEFSLQAFLFAIIESYPSEVRWKSSAATARESFTRVAANTKVGSDQVFQEAKARMLDLNDLLSGTPLASGAKTEVDWSHLIDRVPLMQLLDWAYEENLSKLVASESEFKDNADAIARYAELIAVLGKLSLADEMPDAGDDDYASLANAMIAQTEQVGIGLKTGNADLARSAAAQIGQACTKCHDAFR